MKEIIPYLLVLIPFLPLGASLVNALCFYRVSQKPSKSLNYATAFISIFALIGVLLSYIVIAVFHPHLNSDLSATIIEGGQWFASSSVKFNFSLRYDALTQLMILIVVVVGLMVHIFSVGYLGDRVEDFARYFSWLSFFMFSMLLLVLASNLTLVFLAWEAVGLSSYKLISFYVERKDAQKAGQKAFIINRIGDAAFLLAIFALIQLCSSTEFSDIYRVFESNPLAQKYAGFIGLCIFFAAAAKSAQLPLFTWLPSAMTGPTPVSALIHAATMVTAGVFLILRMQPIYYHSPEASNIVAFAGALTALTGAVIASTQIDIKKILAYSTVSQLGFMVTALGVGAYSASLFHLFTHAFFKALLFLGAGAVITYLHHEQNIRKMGGLAKSYPLLALCFWIGLLSLSGIPGFSGFFSKDHILLSSYAAIRGGELLFTLLTLTTGLTAFYSFRAGILVFHGESRVEKSTIHHADHKPGISFYFPLILLSIFAVVAGLWGVPALLTGYAPALFEYLDRNWAMQADRTSTAFIKHYRIRPNGA